MKYRLYKVRYAKTGEVFTKSFQFHHFLDAGVFSNDGMPEAKALMLVNKWNSQNATSGFTYWVE